jgi:CMP-N-acetylneuraminic acid synthetase
MKPICLIAARKNSKGVPNKNIKSFLGKPLISYAIASSIHSKIFQSVVVSTENDQIAKISKAYGADIPFKRSKSLARDTSSMDDVILDTILKLQSLGYNFDTLVNRDCTAPFIKNSDILASVKLLKKKNCDAVVASYDTHLNPYFNMMEYKKNGFLDFSKKTKKRISQRQKAPIVLQLTSFQVINVKQFLKNKKIYSSKVLPYLISYENGLMIDTKYEFKIAECLAKNYFKNFL